MKRGFRKWTALACVLTLLLSAPPVSDTAGAKAKTRLNKKKVTVRVGKSVKLKLKHAKKKVKWSSNKKRIAVVSKKGRVTGKRPGKAKITAKCGGKRYVCRVTVRKRGASPDEENSQPTATPTSTDSPLPGNSNFPNGASTQSAQVKPASCPDNTLGVGNLQITLGMTAAEVEAKTGGKPDRIDTSSLGYTAYIYNPSLDYTNYVEIQFDNDKVVCISTISNYFRYENILAAGEDTETTLQQKGFKSMSGEYDYSAGYVYETDNEYVTAFVDHQGDGKVYAAEIYSKQTSKSANTDLKDLARAEAGTYNGTVHADNAKELFDWACAFRAVKGLPLFRSINSSAAQKHSEDMAKNNSTKTDSSDGTSREKRFEDNYGLYRYSSEGWAVRNLDAFGVITWLIDSKSAGTYSPLTLSKDKNGNDVTEYYLCTGFASNTSSSNVTFAVLDMYYF